ncbi:MAG TPA: glycosyltransferase family 4 protein [Acidimicrobiales bacterium]|jgi:glycosyltransferase involved in cell wall biosynthesis|nr:glycosyltransferase family 4 protein [Acidimicrobiales bacterium]
MPAADTPLRIALLTYRGKPTVGGQGVYVRHLAKALVDLGHHVEVFGGQPYPVLDPRIPLHELRSLDTYNDHFPARKPRVWELKSVPDVFEALSFASGNFPEPMAFSWRAFAALRGRRGDFDVVHDNQTLGWGILALERSGFPVLETVHHPISVDRRLELEHSRNLWDKVGKRRWYAFTKMQRRVAQRMRHVATVSESSKADIHRDYGVPLERMTVVPVGVDADMFRPVPGVTRVPGRILCTTSSDVTLKGLRYLLEAVAKLRTERPIELVIIGKPRSESRTPQFIAQFGLTDVVTFVHGVTDERIVELYSECELAVVPSLYEGFSLPAVEAMSSGVPLLATTGGALPEVAGAHGETCFLVPPGDSDAMAAMIRTVLDDAAWRARVGAAGRRRVVDNWSWIHTARVTVEQYRAVIADRERRPVRRGATT